MSNIRSASSRTRYVIRWRLMILPELVVKSSIIRPGVQTTTSDPRFISAMLSLRGVPPYAHEACTQSPISAEFQKTRNGEGAPSVQAP